VNAETRAALSAASYQLIIESGFASRAAAGHRHDAEEHEKRAQGLRDAAALIDAALSEDPS
jgi:hypothetical protein